MSHHTPHSQLNDSELSQWYPVRSSSIYTPTGTHGNTVELHQQSQQYGRSSHDEPEFVGASHGAGEDPTYPWSHLSSDADLEVSVNAGTE